MEENEDEKIQSQEKWVLDDLALPFQAHFLSRCASLYGEL